MLNEAGKVPSEVPYDSSLCTSLKNASPRFTERSTRETGL